MKSVWVQVSRVIGVIVFVALIAGGSILAYRHFSGPPHPIPTSITKQLTLTPIYPVGDPTIKPNVDSIKYDSGSKILSYTLNFGGSNMVVSEQPTPDSFVDIPEAYGKFTDILNNYSSFDTEIGTVHLTHPKELNGRQAAVLNTKGTLLFAKPDKDLTNDQWRQFFNALDVVK